MSSSSKSEIARGSSLWPSQNSAVLRSSGWRFVRATRIRAGTPSSAGATLDRHDEDNLPFLLR